MEIQRSPPKESLLEGIPKSSFSMPQPESQPQPLAKPKLTPIVRLPKSMRLHKTSKSISMLNPACEAFNPTKTPAQTLQMAFNPMLEHFSGVPANALALVSTQNGRCPKRTLEAPPSALIVRTDAARDIERKTMAIWDEYRTHPLLYDMQTPQNRQDLYNFFDAVDLHVEGHEFCFKVLVRLSQHSQEQASITRSEIDKFAKDWVAKDGAYLQYLGRDHDVTQSHPEFNDDELSRNFDRPEYLFILKQAINHYVHERHLRIQEASIALVRLQQREPSFEFQNMYMQDKTQRSNTVSFSSAYGRQDSRFGGPQQPHGNSLSLAQTTKPDYRSRGWSNASRGSNRRVNDRRGKRSSPSHENQASPPCGGRYSPSRHKSGHYRTFSGFVPLEGILSETDSGPCRIYTHPNGDFTCTYDGLTREHDKAKQIPLTALVENYHFIRNWRESHELKKLMSQSGQVVSIAYTEKENIPRAFVQFAEASSVHTAVRKFDGFLVGPHATLVVKARNPHKNILGSNTGSNEKHRYSTVGSVKHKHGRNCSGISVRSQMSSIPLGSIENLPSKPGISKEKSTGLKDNSPKKTHGSAKNKRQEVAKENIPMLTAPTRIGNRSRSAHHTNSKSPRKQRTQSDASFRDFQTWNSERLDTLSTDESRDTENAFASVDACSMDNHEDKEKVPASFLNWASSATGNTESKLKKKSKPKKKKPRNENALPEPANPSLYNNTDIFSPVNSFHSSTNDTSFSTNSSKNTSFALSDKVGAEAGKSRRAGEDENEEPLLGDSKVSDISANINTSRGDGGKLGSANSQGHAKNGGSSSVRKSDADRKHTKHGSFGRSNNKSKKRNAEKGCAYLPSGETIASMATNGGLHIIETERASTVVLKAKEAEASSVNDKAATSNGLAAATNPSDATKEKNAVDTETSNQDYSKVYDELVIPSACPDGTLTPILGKKKQIPLVAVPRNFPPRPQSLITNDANENHGDDEDMELGSEAWPFVKSVRPL